MVKNMKKLYIVVSLLVLLSLFALGCSKGTETNDTATKDVSTEPGNDQLFMQGYWLNVPKGYACEGGYNGWVYQDAICTPKKSDFDHSIWFDYGFVVFAGTLEDAKQMARNDYGGRCTEINTANWELDTQAFTCYYSTDDNKPAMMIGLVHENYYLDATLVTEEMDADMSEHKQLLIDFAKRAVVWQPEGTPPPE